MQVKYQQKIETSEQKICDPDIDFEFIRKAFQNNWATCNDPGTNIGHF